MYKIKEKYLPDLFKRIAEEQSLYVPVKKDDQVNFDCWEENSEVDLNATNTSKSPKDLFFPSVESMYAICHSQGKMQVDPKSYREGAFVIFGMRACDVRALTILDAVFLEEPQDSYYADRRSAGLLIGMGCTSPDTSCFCKSFGIDATSPGADIDTWMIEDELYWKPVTKRGEELTKHLGDILEAAEDTAVAANNEKMKEIMKRLPLNGISLKGWGEEALNNRFESPVWEKLSETCLACGTCTFVCPTCQCYDIKDYSQGEEVVRYRCWDSCMYSDFTMMAHGNNRTSQMQRFRQRFMHKLCYYPANKDGVYSCVGCGRCIAKCPASLHIAKVMKEFENAEVLL